jgi:hypothetical protein
MKKKLLEFDIREFIVRNVEGGVVNLGVGHVCRQVQTPSCSTQAPRQAEPASSPVDNLSGKGPLYRD